MKKTVATMLTAALLGAAGCATTNPSGPQGYEADRPLPLEKSSAAPAKGERTSSRRAPAPADEPAEREPMRMPSAQSKLDPEDINETNYPEHARRLDGQFKREGRAMAQARPSE